MEFFVIVLWGKYNVVERLSELGKFPVLFPGLMQVKVKSDAYMTFTFRILRLSKQKNKTGKNLRIQPLQHQVFLDPTTSSFCELF